MNPVNDQDLPQAGLETDIQVAEKVMGWRRHASPCWACASHWRPHYERAGLSNCLPRFSGDLNSAMEAFLAAFDDDQVCLRRRRDGEWEVSCWDPDGHHETIAAAPSPALAICRAALRVAGVRKPLTP